MAQRDFKGSGVTGRKAGEQVVKLFQIDSGNLHCGGRMGAT